MTISLTARERMLALAAAALAAFAAFGPHVAAPANYHQFADTRAWAGIPNAADVLSNLAFVVAGLAGLWAVHAARGSLQKIEHAMATLFFSGLVLTAGGSAWYHWSPDEARLALDRAAMAVAFAGLLGLAAATHVSQRAGAALGLLVLLAAPWAVQRAQGGELLPWAVLQFGGMALLAALAFVPRLPNALQVRWLAVLAIYAVAKLCEAADAPVLEGTRGVLAGHSLKHLIAAAAAGPLVAALRAGGWKSGHAVTAVTP